jgi:sortase (surface protein transpeptidase)
MWPSSTRHHPTMTLVTCYPFEFIGRTWRFIADW